MMRTALAVLIATTTLTSCGGTSDPPDAKSGVAATTSSTPNTAESPEYDGPTIPEGSYRKEVSRADMKQAGLTPADFDYGTWPPGRNALVTYRFVGDSWTQFGGFQGSSLSPGSKGTHSYDDQGRLILTEACCGDTTVQWKLSSGQLTMKVTGPAEPLQDPMTQIARDGTYTSAD